MSFFNILIFIFFSTQFNNKKKICQTHGFNPTHVGWVELGWTYVMGWVRLNFFLTHHDGLGQKIPSTRPNPTHAHPYTTLSRISPSQSGRWSPWVGHTFAGGIVCATSYSIIFGPQTPYIYIYTHQSLHQMILYHIKSLIQNYLINIMIK